MEAKCLVWDWCWPWLDASREAKTHRPAVHMFEYNILYPSIYRMYMKVCVLAYLVSVLSANICQKVCLWPHCPLSMCTFKHPPLNTPTPVTPSLPPLPPFVLSQSLHVSLYFLSMRAPCVKSMWSRLEPELQDREPLFPSHLFQYPSCPSPWLFPAWSAAHRSRGHLT